MSPPNILEVMLFRMSARVTATVVCCILMQILDVVSQKSFSFWRTSSPRPPTGAPPRIPLGDFRPPDLQSSFMSPPPIILWDRRRWIHVPSGIPLSLGLWTSYPLPPPMNVPQNLKTGSRATWIFRPKCTSIIPRVQVCFPVSLYVEPFGYDDLPNDGTVKFWHDFGHFPISPSKNRGHNEVAPSHWLISSHLISCELNSTGSDVHWWFAVQLSAVHIRWDEKISDVNTLFVGVGQTRR